MTRIPGEHVPNIKNRSSKNLICLTKHTPIVKTMSNEALNKLSSDDAVRERKRRAKKNDKKNNK